MYGKRTKTAHPPAIDQPIVWGVQLMPFSSKNAVCSMAAVFSAGHSGRGMWKDGKKVVGIVRESCWTGALGSAGFDERPLFGCVFRSGRYSAVRGPGGGYVDVGMAECSHWNANKARFRQWPLGYSPPLLGLACLQSRYPLPGLTFDAPFPRPAPFFAFPRTSSLSLSPQPTHSPSRIFLSLLRDPLLFPISYP